eukprot:s1753_g3.t2
MMELLREREGFRLAELERFRKVFQDFDTDDSGDMSAGELVSAMGWLGFPTANELVRDFYQTSDLNGNGVLSFSEFVIFLSHIQDRELVSIRNFLALKSKDGKISTLLELEAFTQAGGFHLRCCVDALQEAGFCTKAEVFVLRLDWQGMQLDVDDICALLQCLRSREGFTDAQMDDLRQAFWQSEPKDEDRISTSGGLHKTLRWLGHCHSFERLQQLIYEVDPEGSQCLDFTTFVKLVRKCRDFERGASVKLLDNSRVSMDLNDFLLFVARLEKERLRMEFYRVAKDGSSELKRHELPRLVEVLFPVYAHSPEFRPILVRLLKEVKLDERQAVKYMDFLQLIRTIRDETEKHQCLVYAETIRRLEFSFREASEFLSVFLSASEEAQRKLSSEDLVTLFQQCFDISERECHQLHECFLISAKTIPSKSRSAAPTQSCSFTAKRPEESQSFPPSMGFQEPKSSEETGVDFLDFLEIMRRVIEAGLGGLGVYEPVTFLFRVFLARYVGLSARVFAASGMLLHGLAAVLASANAELVLCRLCGRKPGSSTRLFSAAAAALVAAHPMRAEVVCWSSCQGYLLASICCLLCFRFYIWGRRYSGALLFGLAVCSKASAVTFPCALFAWELLSDEDPMVLAAARAAVKLWPYVPPAVCAAVMAMVAASGAPADARPLDSLERVLRASYPPCFYLWRTFAPPWQWTTPRCALPEKLELADFRFASALAFLAATLAFCICFAALEALGARSWSCRALSLAWATYLALLLPQVPKDLPPIASAMQSSRLPLKQYELTLQNAQRVLASLLEQPAKPWVPFNALVDELSGQLSALRQRSAACVVQRAIRHSLARIAQKRAGQLARSARKPPSTSNGYFAEAPKRALVPVPPPLPPSSGHALNPLEKRRQMVAAQLAISNPSRLARSRRPQHSSEVVSQNLAAEKDMAAPAAMVTLPKLQTGSSAQVVSQISSGSYDKELPSTAPLELLLKDGLGEGDVDQIALLGQCDSAGISMAPPPSEGAKRPGSAPRQPCQPNFAAVDTKDGPTPPSTAPTGEFHSTVGSLPEACSDCAAARSEHAFAYCHRGVSLGVVSIHIWALAADRYVYLPSLCILMPCTAALLQSLCEGCAWKCRALLVALGIVYLLSCAWRAHEVACHWASGSSSLFEAILHEQPDQFSTLKDFGTLELKRGKLEKAKALLSYALRIRPDHSGLLLNIATLLHQSKETAEAEAMYRRACTSAKAAVELCQGCQPAATELAKAHANYGGLLLQSARHVDAAKVLEAGQPWDGAVDSARGPGFFHLCLAHRGLGRLESALRNCHTAAAAQSQPAKVCRLTPISQEHKRNVTDSVDGSAKSMHVAAWVRLLPATVNGLLTEWNGSCSSPQFIYLLHGASVLDTSTLQDRSNRDVLWLSFDKQYHGEYGDIPTSDVLYEPQAWWGEGRNLLLEAALHRRHRPCWPGYLYFVFLDDDMLAMVPQTGSWTKFEKFLLEELPAVGYITRTRHYHSLGRGKATRGSLFNVDHNALAFHRHTLGSLLPYCDFLKRNAVGWSGAILTLQLGAPWRADGSSNARKCKDALCDVSPRALAQDLAQNLHRPYKRGGGSYAFDLLKQRFQGEMLSDELLEAYWGQIGTKDSRTFCNYNYNASRKPPGQQPAGPISIAWLMRHINVSHPCGRVMFAFLRKHSGYLETLRARHPEFEADSANFDGMPHCQWNLRPWVGGSSGVSVSTDVESGWCRGSAVEDCRRVSCAAHQIVQFAVAPCVQATAVAVISKAVARVCTLINTRAWHCWASTRLRCRSWVCADLGLGQTRICILSLGLLPCWTRVCGVKIPEKRFCRLSGDSDRDNGFWHLYLFETRANSDEHISSRAPRILAISFHLACVVVGLRALKIAGYLAVALGPGQPQAICKAGARIVSETNKMSSELRICEGGSGIWLPLGGDWERDWPTGVKVALYLLGLLYCFLGVAIIADVFMASIEKVTSVKKQVTNKETGKKTTVKVWNDTVANLTLMALGSSAPEILLSIIELAGANFYSGSLGASTIVGSAAFNLLGITAVCIAALPDGEIKIIKDRKVFAITGTFSVFAYLWLLIILMVFSQDMVDPWEGVVTFLFFPLLVILSYMADIGMFGKTREPSSHIVWSEATPEQLAELMMQVRRDFGDNLSQEQILAALHYESHKRRSRAQYRVAAVRDISAGKKVLGINDKFREQLEATRTLTRMTNDNKPTRTAASGATVEFVSSQYSVLESVGTAKFGLARTGDCSVPVTVLWRTRCGSAQAGKDFKMQEGNILFEEGDTEKVVEVEIIDDDDYEDDQEFYMEICSAVATGNVEAHIGEKKEATVVIVDDDLPGIIGFVTEEIKVEESPQTQQVEIKIRRKMGASGTVTCKYRTEDASAKAGPDYTKLEGELELKPGQMEASLYVDIMPKGRYESTEKFRVILEEPSGGLRFDVSSDGGSESCVCTVWILADVSHKPFMDKIVSSLSPNWDEVALGNTAWLEQFFEALYCGGDREEQSKSSWFEFVLHVMSLPWKVVFALVPPTEYCGGWLCFFIALVMIGCVTIIIGDLASLLGCSMNINDLQTAITLVAMGTSLPDTFASRTAARQDEYADASIGNVTGSNSVNVFLGIGLPWMIGAIYWNIQGATPEWQAAYPGLVDTHPNGGFYVSSEGLAFSVAVFSCCAVVCFGVLIFRRSYFGGELGGPKPAQYISGGVLVLLWAIYIGLSIWFSS